MRLLCSRQSTIVELRARLKGTRNHNWISKSLCRSENQYASFASPLCSVLIHWRHNENRDEKVSLPRALSPSSPFLAFFFFLLVAWKIMSTRCFPILSRWKPFTTLCSTFMLRWIKLIIPWFDFYFRYLRTTAQISNPFDVLVYRHPTEGCNPHVIYKQIPFRTRIRALSLRRGISSIARKASA